MKTFSFNNEARFMAVSLGLTGTRSPRAAMEPYGYTRWGVDLPGGTTFAVIHSSAMEEDLRGHAARLNERGLGPDKLVCVNAPVRHDANPWETFLADQSAKELFADELLRGKKLVAYHGTEAALRFVEHDLGLSWSTASRTFHPSVLYTGGMDRESFFDIAHSCGIDEDLIVKPEFVPVEHLVDGVTRAMADYSTNHGIDVKHVIVRVDPVLSISGLGHKNFTGQSSSNDMNAYIRQCKQEGFDPLVFEVLATTQEELEHGREAIINFRLDEEGPLFMGIAMQLHTRTRESDLPGNHIHRGSMAAPLDAFQAIIPGFLPSTVENTLQSMEPINALFLSQGYRGYHATGIRLDDRSDRKHRAMLLKENPRFNSEDWIHQNVHQLRKCRGASWPWVAKMMVFQSKASNIQSSRALDECLIRGGLFIDASTGYGIIPRFPEDMGGEWKTVLICIGRSLGHAEELYQSAVKAINR